MPTLQKLKGIEGNTMNFYVNKVVNSDEEDKILKKHKLSKPASKKKKKKNPTRPNKKMILQR